MKIAIVSLTTHISHKDDIYKTKRFPTLLIETNKDIWSNGSAIICDILSDWDFQRGSFTYVEVTTKEYNFEEMSNKIFL